MYNRFLPAKIELCTMVNTNRYILLLIFSVNVLYNYLEANAKVPWEDLRYLFGEIMYGGHITDDWDRRLCKTYLSEFLHPDMVCFSRLIFYKTGLAFC